MNLLTTVSVYFCLAVVVVFNLLDAGVLPSL